MKRSFKSKRNKILSAILSISLLSTIMCSPLNVSAAGNLAYSIGCNYGAGNIDTTPIVRKACDYYALCGYTSRYNMNPDVTDPVKTYNGTKKIEADIVMMTGHGNPGGMYFNSLNQGGKYDFWITDNTSATGCVILQNYNMNNVNLMVFNGCNTAQGDYNVCRTVVDRGCTVSIGWPETIYTDCSEKWLDKFNNYLATGNTVRRAAEIANSFSYSNDSIKRWKIYGNGNITVKKSKAKVANTEELNSTIVNQVIALENLNNKSSIAAILNSIYPTFNFEDFKIDLAMQEDGSGTITVVEKIGDYYSDNAYVLFYDGSKITEAFERVENSIDRTVYSDDYFNLPQIDMEQVYAAARENIGAEYTIEGQEAEAKIDSATGERYLLVGTTISIDGAKSVMPYKYVIQ